MIDGVGVLDGEHKICILCDLVVQMEVAIEIYNKVRLSSCKLRNMMLAFSLQF